MIDDMGSKQELAVWQCLCVKAYASSRGSKWWNQLARPLGIYPTTKYYAEGGPESDSVDSVN